MVLFTSATDEPAFAERVRSLRKLQDGPYFEYFEIGECTFGFDGTGDVVSEYDSEELSEITALVRDFKASLVEYENATCRNNFILRMLPGLHGVVDTNFGDTVPYSELIDWIARNPERHFRDGLA
ncbi:hypothetical protein OG266_27130 [Streptomyces sp. NBC_00554]|nr:hypothetical protein OG256_17800 [Streptomyces sp. NBC_00564]WUC51833.1 hypothetical protein OG266_27130 [Streptomyces sp. NBC_00554]